MFHSLCLPSTSTGLTVEGEDVLEGLVKLPSAHFNHWKGEIELGDLSKTGCPWDSLGVKTTGSDQWTPQV